MADANITKAVLLLKQNEITAVPDIDHRFGFRAAEGSIEVLPSYAKVDGDLSLMDLPLFVIPMPAGGTYIDFVNAVIFSAQLGHAVA